MAEAEANPSFGGYDDDFVSEVEDELQCTICRLPLKDPILTKCGHRFCRDCLDRHFASLERNGKPLICPKDRNNITRDEDTFADKATERKILSLLITCLSEGCQWTGELRSKDDHLASCLFKSVSCTNKNCDVKLTRNTLQEHVTMSCPWRIVSCQYCLFSTHPACKTDIHQSKCRRFPLDCPESCGAVIPRGKILFHIKEQCPLTLIPCPYAQIGCTTKIKRGEVESHLQSTVKMHLDIACVELGNTQRELAKTKEQLEDTFVRSQQEFKEITRTLEGKINNLARKLEIKIDGIEKLVLSSDEQNYFNWKVSGFSKALKKAKHGEKTSIPSDPFYRYAYKCRLVLDPNGYGIGENTHLSIFLFVMKSEYDAILSWPLNTTITFRLIDQQEDANDRENIVKSLRIAKHLRCFARPMTDGYKGRGLTTFVLHKKLKERRYILNDSILIQVQLTPPQ